MVELVEGIKVEQVEVHRVVAIVETVDLNPTDGVRRKISIVFVSSTSYLFPKVL